MAFKNRSEAGQKLAEKLLRYKDFKPIVYALPRGGVVLGYEIAQALDCPLDLVITRKIGHLYHPEYAVAAVSESGKIIYNEQEKEYLDKDWLNQEVRKQIQEIKRRRDVYLGGRPSLDARNKLAIIVDDGIATGLTILAAIEELKSHKPRKIIVAVPVATKEFAEKIQNTVELVALEIPKIYLGAVGAYYQSFDQTSDQEVIKLLSLSIQKDNS